MSVIGGLSDCADVNDSAIDHRPRQNRRFIVQALRGESITIFGDGSQTRSFCYVDDLIEAMVRMMATGDDITGPVNVGNPGEFSMLELAQLVLGLTGSKSKLEFRPLPADGPRQRRPDISLAHDVFGGWQPTVAIEEGLLRTIAHFRDRLASSN